MKYGYLFFLLLLTIESVAASEQLFNGHDLTGWKQVGAGNFTVKNHLLITSGGMGLLFYEKAKFKNAKL